jgi:phosphate starvation-inducible protein PhoH
MAKTKVNKRVSLTTVREKSKLIQSVSAMNAGQKEALRSIASDSHITVLSGIAGSGKSYISASWGLEQLLHGKYERMIITRPYVEAGEKLGYLP